MKKLKNHDLEALDALQLKTLLLVANGLSHVGFYRKASMMRVKPDDLKP
jgi:hypothetical protein